jgi:hypothetical protein
VRCRAKAAHGAGFTWPLLQAPISPAAANERFERIFGCAIEQRSFGRPPGSAVSEADLIGPPNTGQGFLPQSAPTTSQKLAPKRARPPSIRFFCCANAVTQRLLCSEHQRLTISSSEWGDHSASCTNYFMTARARSRRCRDRESEPIPKYTFRPFLDFRSASWRRQLRGEARCPVDKPSSCLRTSCLSRHRDRRRKHPGCYGCRYRVRHHLKTKLTEH